MLKDELRVAEYNNVIRILMESLQIAISVQPTKNIAKFYPKFICEYHSDINILQGNVATHLRYGGTFDSLALLQIYF